MKANSMVQAVIGDLTGTKSKRMTMDSIQSSRRQRPDRIFLMGIESVGKSTFGADAPDPIFIPCEDGLAHLDVAAYPLAESLTDVLDAVDDLANRDHGYRTVVIDTLDALEPMIWADVCREHNAASIEEVLGGYGKGYMMALARWRLLLNGLDRLRDKGMTVILLAHTHVKNFSDPKSAHDWSRYEAKMNVKAAGVVREWCDVALFAAFDTWAEKRKGGGMKMHGAGGDRRVVYTQHNAAYDAKSRFPMPVCLPFSWASYAEARSAPDDVQGLKDEAFSLAALIPENEVAAKKWIKGLGDDPAKLRVAIDQLKTKVTERAEAMQ